MRRCLPLLALLALPLFAAEGERKPNTLTPKEVAEGWLLLYDGETTFGWKIDGEVKVEKGELVLGGKAKTLVTLPAGYADLHWEYRVDGSGLPVRECVASRGKETIGSSKGKLSSASRAGKGLPTVERWKIQADPKGSTANEAKFHADSSVGIRLDTVISFPPGCHVTTTLEIPAGTKLSLRDVKLRPTGLEPLFNGKDLTGWTVFKGNPKQEKSKWTVTKEGWLNVKDGPGDLQTDKLFDDFVLQFECLSNGKHLNSGLFFRCEPGKYQQGYEAQIRNQFTDKPTQKYTIEEYDPTTNKLVGKKELMATAFDYGTGAIYRRVPARKGIAKDGEWFTMTVVARGRHIATFVNGVQVVDWTDNRPENDNGRNGYRGKAGAISIQGHDPTTDLSFRNLRVAPLPR